MAPNSRIILTRHAQAEHNVDLDYSIPDAPLTALGRKQATALSKQIPDLQSSADLIVSSPLKRTLQTTLLGWTPALTRLGGRSAIICLPQAQECNAHPCDTGSSRATLEQDAEFHGLDFHLLSDDWTSKRGFWSEDRAVAIPARAKWVRQWLFARPEREIVLVAHGDILRQITGDVQGESAHGWRNAEVRVFSFEQGAREDGECWLVQEEDVAAAGGYGPTSSEADFEDGSVEKL